MAVTVICGLLCLHRPGFWPLSIGAIRLQGQPPPCHRSRHGVLARRRSGVIDRIRACARSRSRFARPRHIHYR
jgi:hypothetical protein